MPLNLSPPQRVVTRSANLNRAFIMRLIALLLACMLMFPFVGHAKVYKVDEVRMVHLEDATRYVCNPDTILSSLTVVTIDSMLYALEKSTGIETVVMALTDIDGGDCYQFALEVGQKYGVGKKETDNGLVVLLSTQQRCIQFVTGYGLEGTLTDAICRRIQEESMNPYFSKDEWDKGMLEGMKALQGHLDGSMVVEAEEDWTWLDFIGLFCAVISFPVLLLVLIVWYDSRPKICPRCNKRSLKAKSKQKLYEKYLGRGKWEKCHHVVYVCSKCGHTEERDEVSTYHVGSSGSSGGSSSSGGGSFGGGGFGGGGAGSRF